ncbi:hypothetical protein Brsp01_21560 [Brucella sp. NBRC 12950]|nr:hypothetical protein Brsp01_21560 [Brucella sp. NBRC 12950]
MIAMPETTAIADRKEVEKRRDMMLSSNKHILKETLMRLSRVAEAASLTNLN